MTTTTGFRRIGTVYNDEGQRIVFDRYTEEGERGARRNDGAKALVALLQECFGPDVAVKASYSRKAGCPCGCSPGFALSVAGTSPTLREFLRTFGGERAGKGEARAEFWLRDGVRLDGVRMIAEGRQYRQRTWSKNGPRFTYVTCGSFNVERTKEFVAWATDAQRMDTMIAKEAAERAASEARRAANERYWREEHSRELKEQAARERDAVTEVEIEGFTFAVA